MTYSATPSLAAFRRDILRAPIARSVRISAPKTGKWALVGQGPLADAIAAAWPFNAQKSANFAAQNGAQNSAQKIFSKNSLAQSASLGMRDGAQYSPAGVTLLQWPGFDKNAPAVDGVIDAMSGVNPALDVALTGLARGIPVVTANAMLLAAHGRVLAAAATGDGLPGALLHAEGAVLGSVPVASLLPMAERVVVTFGGAADMLLQRMHVRGEAMATSEQALRSAGVVMDDIGGKQTLVKALALHGLWRGGMGNGWLGAGDVRRVMPEAVTEKDMFAVQKVGLTVRYGAVIEAHNIYVGPFAVAEGTFAVEGTTLMVDSVVGTQVVKSQSNPMAASVAGILYGVQQSMMGMSGVCLPMTQGAPVVQVGYFDGPVYMRREGELEGVVLPKTSLLPEAGLSLPIVGDLPRAAGLRRVA